MLIIEKWNGLAGRTTSIIAFKNRRKRGKFTIRYMQVVKKIVQWNITEYGRA